MTKTVPENKRISHGTHKYYRAVILPAIAEYCGYDLENGEAHRSVKAAFYGMHPDSPELPSMAAMTQVEAGRFLDFAVREAAKMGLILPDSEARQ